MPGKLRSNAGLEPDMALEKKGNEKVNTERPGARQGLGLGRRENGAPGFQRGGGAGSAWQAARTGASGRWACGSAGRCPVGAGTA